MDTHPTLRVQFFLAGPFDPIEGLSVTILDRQWEEQGSLTLGGHHAQYELWSKVAEMAAHLLNVYGEQKALELE